MPRYVEASTGREIPSSLALFADGTPKPGVSVRGDIMGDGQHIHFNPMMMDARSIGGARFMSDAADTPLDRSAVEAQRRRWMADKANAHRAKPQNVAPPASSARSIVDSAPMAPASAKSGRAAIEAQRRIWLADKANAHRRVQR